MVSVKGLIFRTYSNIFSIFSTKLNQCDRIKMLMEEVYQRKFLTTIPRPRHYLRVVVLIAQRQRKQQQKHSMAAWSWSCSEAYLSLLGSCFRDRDMRNSFLINWLYKNNFTVPYAWRINRTMYSEVLDLDGSFVTLEWILIHVRNEPNFRSGLQHQAC